MSEPITHFDHREKGRVEIATMFGEHAYNTADKMEREGSHPQEVIDAVREHAHKAYDAWAAENPEKAEEAKTKRTAKGLPPRGRPAND